MDSGAWRSLRARLPATRRVLLLDEVFNGLDERAKEKLRRALEQPRGGHEWILTSHRPHELPANVTHIAHIEGGRIIAAGKARSRGSCAHSRPRSGLRLESASIADAARAAARAVMARAHSRRRHLPRLPTGHSRAGLDAAARRALGDPRCERLRQVDVAEPDLRRSASRARRHDRAAGRPPALASRTGSGASAGCRRSCRPITSRAGRSKRSSISGRYSSVGLNDPPTRGGSRAAQALARILRHRSVCASVVRARCPTARCDWR